jgi:cysteine desulfurase
MEHMIYLDYAATTPCDARVLDAMCPYWTTAFANPSSTHRLGRQAAYALENARSHILRLCAAGHGDITFTSGATESNNLATYSLARYLRDVVHRPTILCLPTEHKSVLDPLNWWSDQLGLRVEWLRVTRTGEIDREDFLDRLTEEIGGVVVQAANSETGVVQDLAFVTEKAHEHGATVFADVTQAIGRIPLHFGELELDWASMSSHKVYGPKGIGALYARAASLVRPLSFGGGQESGKRPGTQNVSGAVGFATAVEIALHELPQASNRLAFLRDRMWNKVRKVNGVFWNGSGAPLLPSHLNVTIDGVAAQELMLRTQTVAISAGSACNAASTQPSPVLLHMGRTNRDAECTVRITVGRPTTEAEIDLAGSELVSCIRAIRERL